jgi:hypothetical protein
MFQAVLVLIAGAVALWVWKSLQKPPNVKIRVAGQSIEVGGKALLRKRADVEEFFRTELREVRQARVEGYWDGRYLRLQFHGDLSPGNQQRIRNFLLTSV